MSKQTKQLVALCVLVILSVISYRINRVSPSTTAAAATIKAAKAAQQDSLLKTRFHRVRAEMDGLYHYRIKPAPFDQTANPFRITHVMGIADADRAAAVDPNAKGPTVETQIAPVVAETGEALLAHAIASMRIGGVVTMNDTTQLTVNGQLHRQGDVFTTKVQNRNVLIRIKLLSTSFATLALDDPDAGSAELRVHLK
jgi:hypothetical protein